jgi:hypothetical protein
VRDGASFLMATSPLSIMRDSDLLPCATVCLLALSSAAFFVCDSVLRRDAFRSHSVRDCASFSCATAPLFSTPWRVLHRAHQRPPFMGDSALFPRARGTLDSFSAYGASFSCATVPSSIVCDGAFFYLRDGALLSFSARQRLIQCVTAPSSIVRNGAFFYRARQRPPLIQCATAPHSRA